LAREGFEVHETQVRRPTRFAEGDVWIRRRDRTVFVARGGLWRTPADLAAEAEAELGTDGAPDVCAYALRAGPLPEAADAPTGALGFHRSEGQVYASDGAPWSRTDDEDDWQRVRAAILADAVAGAKGDGRPVTDVVRRAR